jgi:hypothetical protein
LKHLPLKIGHNTVYNVGVSSKDALFSILVFWEGKNGSSLENVKKERLAGIPLCPERKAWAVKGKVRVR